MSKLEIKQPEPQEDVENRWFALKDFSAVYRRGKDGVCIYTDGSITSGLPYGGSTYDIFETDDFIPLPKGTQIIITV